MMKKKLYNIRCLGQSKEYAYCIQYILYNTKATIIYDLYLNLLKTKNLLLFEKKLRHLYKFVLQFSFAGNNKQTPTNELV